MKTYSLIFLLFGFLFAQTVLWRETSQKNPADGFSLSTPLMWKRYIQYRAELWHSSFVYLPWLERIEFTLQPCACPTISALSFNEETIRDGRNLVRVCYTASDPDGDSFFVEMSLSHAGMPVPVHAIYDTVVLTFPNIGWVHNGSHCFVWSMSEDYYGNEGCDFTLVLSINNESTEILFVVDSCYMDDAEGVAWGDDGNLWVTRSSSASGNFIDRIYHIDPFTCEILDSCVIDSVNAVWADCEWHDGYLWIFGGGGFGADSVTCRAQIYKVDVNTCAIVDSSMPLWGGTKWGQGLAWFEGYFWAMDADGNIYRVTSTPPYTPTLWLALEDTFEAYHGGDSIFYGSTSADALVFALGSIWVLRNPASAAMTHILFRFDYSGQVIDSFALPSGGTHGPEGITFDGSCFWYTDHTRDMVYRVCLWGCADTMTVSGCLDSDPPDLDFLDATLCGDTFFVGQIDTTLLYGYDRFLPGGTICSVWVACGSDTVFVGTSPFPTLIWTVPNLPCNNAMLIISAYDSFGNRGDAISCPFMIVRCAPAVFSAICPSAVSFMSCSDAYCQMRIRDTTYAGIDTLRAYFRQIIYHEAGGSTIIPLMSPSPHIFWTGDSNDYNVYISGSFSDGDSVIIVVDSVFNAFDCRILPP